MYSLIRKLEKPPLLTKLLLGAVAVSLFVLLGMIFYFKPWYGVTDDGSLLRICEYTRNIGLSATFQQYMAAEANWGMFRPLYFVMTHFLYCGNPTSAPTTYFLNAVFIYFILFLNAYFLYRATPQVKWRKPLYFAAFFLLSLTIYRFHDLFIIPSLQEKLVLIAGALALGLVAPRVDGGEPQAAVLWRQLLAVFFVLLVGFSSKAQFLLYLPAMGLFLLADLVERGNKRRQWTRFIVFLALAAIGMFLIRKLASQGHYTSAYSFAKVWGNLQTRQALLLLGLGFTSIAFELWYVRKRRLGWVGLLRGLVPGTLPIAFVAIMSPWVIGDAYIVSPAGPMFAFCVASALQKFTEEKYGLILLVIAAFALTLTTYRGFRGFGRLGDLRDIFVSPQLQELAKERVSILVPCEEGSDLFKVYLRLLTPYEKRVEIIRETKLAKTGRIYAISDGAICPFRGAAEAKQFQLISTPRFSGSFGLYELAR